MKKSEAIKLIEENSNFSEARIVFPIEPKNYNYYVIKREGDSFVRIFSNENESFIIDVKRFYKEYLFVDDIDTNGKYRLK